MNESGVDGAASPAPDPRPQPPPERASNSSSSRLWQFLWRSNELAAYGRPRSQGHRDALGRARLAADSARVLLVAPELSARKVEPLACNLYRQSIHWSLAALAQASDAPIEKAATEPQRWLLIDEAPLVKAAGGREDLARVRAVVDSFTFEEFARLERDETVRLLAKLRAVALRLIAEIEVDERAVEAIWVSRILRVAAVVAVLAVAIFAGLRLREGSEKRHDLAVGKPWKASSTYSQGGCHSPDQACPESPDYFFHTDDENEPWFEIDLGKKERVSAVHVFNRVDCCSERSVPLVVELSTDHEKWKDVARRDDLVTDFRADFSTTEARYVRLKLKKQAPLHLMGVRVLP